MLSEIRTKIFRPIIEDDGYISSIFNASLGDTVIIDRDFRIKFKHNEFPNNIIYRQACRFLFENEPYNNELSEKELGNLLKKIYFINIRNNQQRIYRIQ